jgi:phosphoglycolate phosphatase
MESRLAEMSMNYRAVLFDLDGTLLDTLEDLADSVNAALRSLDFPEHPREAYKYFVGDGMEVLVERALPEDHADSATRAECVARLRREYAQRWAVKTRPYAGIPELLDALTARGMAMGVLSNKPDEFTRLCVTRLLSRWEFSAVMGARRTLPRKPDPTGAREMARQMCLAPATFVYLGDTSTDMQTAIAAGMFPVGALWGFRTAEELRASGARSLLEKPLDLLDLLGSKQ